MQVGKKMVGALFLTSPSPPAEEAILNDCPPRWSENAAHSFDSLFSEKSGLPNLTGLSL
jgi:hypothetical protein